MSATTVNPYNSTPPLPLPRITRTIGGDNTTNPATQQGQAVSTSTGGASAGGASTSTGVPLTATTGTPNTVQRRQMLDALDVLEDAGLAVATAAAAVATVVAPEIMGAGPDEALAAADLAALGITGTEAAATATAAGETAAEAATLGTNVAADLAAEGGSVSAEAAATTAEADLNGVAAADAAVGTGAGTETLANGTQMPSWFSKASEWTKDTLNSAGRAYQKHSSRATSLLDKVPGKQQNAAGEALANSILDDQTAVTTVGNNVKYGGDYVDVISHGGDGLGVRYSSSGGFVGFLEPGFPYVVDSGALLP